MRKAKKEYFQKLTERDNNIASMWRALNAFTKEHRSTSADIPKNLTANVFNNHFLSVSESLIEPRTNVYECSNPLHDLCKQKTSRQDPFVIPYLTVSELGKYISRLEKIVWLNLNYNPCKIKFSSLSSLSLYSELIIVHFCICLSSYLLGVYIILYPFLETQIETKPWRK